MSNDNDIGKTSSFFFYNNNGDQEIVNPNSLGLLDIALTTWKKNGHNQPPRALGLRKLLETEKGRKSKRKSSKQKIWILCENNNLTMRM